jgi:DNA-binding NarL/FixJ family response regulator
MSAAGQIRVLLADDHAIVRAGLRRLLEPVCEVVGEAASGEETVELTLRLHPAVVLLDIAMPGLGGMAAARRIFQIAPRSRVLILSQYTDEEYVVEALRDAHAAGYIVKTDAATELLSAVSAVAAGKRYLSPAIASVVLRRFTDSNATAANDDTALTGREREIIRLISEGAPAKEIAARLGISVRTVEAHRENIKQKLNLRSTAAIVRYAIRHKLIQLD